MAATTVPPANASPEGSPIPGYRLAPDSGPVPDVNDPVAHPPDYNPSPVSTTTTPTTNVQIVGTPIPHRPGGGSSFLLWFLPLVLLLAVALVIIARGIRSRSSEAQRSGQLEGPDGGPTVAASGPNRST